MLHAKFSPLNSEKNTLALSIGIIIINFWQKNDKKSLKLKIGLILIYPTGFRVGSDRVKNGSGYALCAIVQCNFATWIVNR